MVSRQKKLGLDKFIKASKSKAFSNEDIERLCEGDVNIYTYPELASMESIDQCLDSPKKVGACIILYMTRSNFGHWVALFRVNNQTLEFWDSYGLMPDQELSMIPQHFRHMSNQMRPHLSELMAAASQKYPNILYNRQRLQKSLSDTATCGRWAGIRVAMRDVPLDQFQKMFTGQHFDPDWYVSALTLFI